MASILINPATAYGGLATIMLLIYSSIESARKEINDTGTRSVMCSWSLISCSVIIYIAITYSNFQFGIATPAGIILMLLICSLTLCISSSILYAAGAKKINF